MGPNRAEHPTSQPKIYELKSVISFQGIIRMPTTPVINPPVRNEIRLGRRLEKSFDGETTLAATFVFSVAIISAIKATNATSGWLNFPSSTTGSQIGAPNSTADAEVTATPINAYSVIAVGNPSACPTICAFCDFA